MIPTKEQVDEFLEESNAIEREYSDQALKDARKAWNYALENKKDFDVDYVLWIHKLLLQVLNPTIAGKVRDCTVYIGGRVCPEKPQEVILDEIDQWIERCKTAKKKATEKELKKWHVEFENIHPFQDGNGRTGRILMNIQRIKHKLPILIIHEGEEQWEYYKWFK